MVKVSNVTSTMPSPPPGGNNRLRLNSSGLTWDPVMSSGIRARMETKRMLVRRKKHRKPIMNQRRIWRTEGIVGLACEAVMSTDMRVWMVTMWMRMRRMKHCKVMMHQ